MAVYAATRTSVTTTTSPGGRQSRSSSACFRGRAKWPATSRAILEEPPDHLDPEWLDLWRDASTAERPLVANLAARGVPLPALGVESAAGIPIPISWPDLLVAVVFGLDEDDVRDLEVEGWTVLPEGPELWDRL